MAPRGLALVLALVAVARAENSSATDDIAEAMSVSKNSKEDLGAFISGLTLNFCIALGCLVAFTALRRFFPKVYSNNILTGKTKLMSHDGWFSWIPATWNLTAEKAAETACLDSALLLESCDLSMRICGILSLPLVFVMCPVNYYYGGGAAGDDVLGSIDMSNVSEHHSWLYYVYAVVVWIVCVAVWWCMRRAQARFLKLRFAWLKQLPMPRAHTLLLENIPRGFRSNDKVREFLAGVLGPDAVADVQVLRLTGKLPKLVKTQDTMKKALYKAELQLEKDDMRPQHRLRACGQRVDSIDHYTAGLEELEPKIQEERARVQAGIAGGVLSRTSSGFAHCAFVTFSTRRQAEIARDVRYTANRRRWLASFPPEPAEVRWASLAEEPTFATGKALVGLAATIALIAFFMPICTFITTSGRSVQVGPLQPIWLAYAPTIGLLIMLSFLPTILLAIFSIFYTMKSDSEAQHKLQVWYFIFQLIFVVLVTAIGNSLIDQANKLVESPLSVFEMLGASLPSATHFYMNYLVLEWAALGIQLLRITNLVKFLLFRTLFSEEEAREMAEPEGQDSDGMGGRYTNFATSMTIAIIFSPLAPLVAPLALVSFALRRLVYGYLMVFAETKKPDLGGSFWATHIHQLQAATVLQCILMVGVLSARCKANRWPVLVAAPSLVFLVWAFQHLGTSLDWRRLPLDEVVAFEAEGAPTRSTEEVYVQPELLEAAASSGQHSEASAPDVDLE